MERFNQITARSRLLLAAALIVLCAGLVFGAARAMYETKAPAAVSFSAGAVGSIELTTGEWSPTYAENDPEKQTGYELEYTVSNTGAEPMDVSVYLLASIGLEYGDNITVYFWSWEKGEWKKYEADFERVTPGSMIDHSFGDGWIYRSYVQDKTTGEWAGRSYTLAPGASMTAWVSIEQWEGFTLKDHPVQLRLMAYEAG